MAIQFGLPGVKMNPAPKLKKKLTFGDKLLKAQKKSKRLYPNLFSNK